MTFSQDALLFAFGVGAGCVGALFGAYFEHHLTLQREKLKLERELLDRLHQQLAPVEAAKPDEVLRAIDLWTQLDAHLTAQEASMERIRVASRFARTTGIVVVLAAGSASILRVFSSTVQSVIAAAIASIEQMLR